MIGLGTKDNPVRCSSLPMLLSCQGFHVMRQLYTDGSGVAATMGTAVGRGAELWHEGRRSEEAVETALGEAEGGLGTRDVETVTQIITAYCEDPRNGSFGLTQVLPESQEYELNFEYEGVYFSGHMDQIRRHEDGKLYVWDLKNGKMYGGQQMTDAYAAQLAMYAVGASRDFNEPVGVGGIIRTRGYIGKANLKLHVGDRPVFFPCDWHEGAVESIASQVVKAVKSINAGEISIGPGSHCGFCPAGGVGNCTKILAELN